MVANLRGWADAFKYINVWLDSDFNQTNPVDTIAANMLFSAYVGRRLPQWLLRFTAAPCGAGWPIPDHLCSPGRGDIFIAHCFQKKKESTPLKDLNVAKSRTKEFIHAARHREV